MQRIFLSEAQKTAGWHQRCYLPHYNAKETPQTITFRLYDSLPSQCLDQWQIELAYMSPSEANSKRRELIEAYLDKGAGEKYLQDPQIAAMVADSLLHFNQVRYRLHAWVIMPNHVHVLISPIGDTKLSEVIHSWKGYTARTANRILGRTGVFWQRDYFDRFIRDSQHFFSAVHYIEDNPVKAGLCRAAGDWEFSSAGYRRVGRCY